MPQITKLKLQKNRRVVNIFIDNKFTTSLELTTVAKIRLRVGMDISNHDLTKLIKGHFQEKLMSNAFNFLSYRPRSEKEVRTYLKKKIFRNPQIPKETIDKVVNKLSRKKYIDDQQFAKWWIDQRTKHNQKGRRLIALELLAKGINKSVIDDFLSERNDEKPATTAAKKKARSLKNHDYKTAKKKLIAFLQRRGFTWETIKTVVDETLPKK